MVLRLNKFLKLAESIVSLHTRLLTPSSNFRPFLHWMIHSSHVDHDASEDPILLPTMIMPKEVHLRQLAT